ncbi:hypothetical protein POTG_04204 [Paenibacillus sp. oral taxon 786 str. D14]|nr:hypothetical protein POTG_04204 [Paenibacillus sp. oral taxon 786 str. D14]
MKKKEKKFLPRSVPISHQIEAMYQSFPNFEVTWERNKVVWTGTIQPTTASKIYIVRIKYSIEMVQPEVYVVSPKLKRRKGSDENIPHLYTGERLCLFRPKKKEWTKQMLIAETIVPWTSLWLYHYEVWHVLGEWMGGGEHPSERHGRARVSDFRD